MAVEQSIREALQGLVDALVEFDSVVEMLHDLTAEHPPPAWIFVVERQRSRIRDRVEQLESLLLRREGSS